MSAATPQVRVNDLMQRARIAVRSERDHVVLTLGNVDVKMDYETALKLSQWLRVRGKEAKRFAGDVSRHWSVIGTLHDANVTRG